MRAKGFTLIELAIVIVIIGISTFAALAGAPQDFRIVAAPASDRP